MQQDADVEASSRQARAGIPVTRIVASVAVRE
jgi:hypothetical protein